MNQSTELFSSFKTTQEYPTSLNSSYRHPLSRDNHSFYETQISQYDIYRQSHQNNRNAPIDNSASDMMTTSKRHYPFDLYQNQALIKSNSVVDRNIIQSPLQKINKKPKIIFSYHKQQPKQVDFQRFYASKKDQKKDRSINIQQIKEFELVIQGKNKKMKNKIQNNVMQFVNNPAFYTKKEKLQKSISKGKQRYRKGQTYAKKTQFISIMASTQATTSHLNQPNCDFNELMTQKSNKKLQFLYKSKRSQTKNHKKSLTDKLSPSKLLKKTIMLSKNNFNDIFKNTSLQSSSRFVTNDVNKDNKQKWINFAKCLFDGQQNMKESIHCGPDTKKQEINDVLVGFGRQIGYSSIQNLQ